MEKSGIETPLPWNIQDLGKKLDLVKFVCISSLSSILENSMNMTSIGVGKTSWNWMLISDSYS